MNHATAGRVLLTLAPLGLGAAAGWLLSPDWTKEITRTVAIKWGDGKYGPAFYGAQVYLEPVGARYSVRGRVWIGPGSSYWHDCGVLGQVGSHEEAVEKWGTITWRPEGLSIGTGGPDDYFLPRERVESHR